MKWFFGFNQGASKWFGDMVRVAVVTAEAHAPQLEPHCLYHGEAETDVTAWLRARGVAVQRAAAPVSHRLAAPDILARNANTGYNAVAAQGFYLCLAVPGVAADEQHVLFTDCDVMFTGPVDLAGVRPSLLAAAPEMDDVRRPAPSVSGRGFNSGVMVMNVAGMLARIPSIEAVLERDAYFPTNGAYDQGALNSAIPAGDWEPLPHTLNWRPAFGINPQASIVHWHGPKPRHVEKTLATGVTTAPDEVMRGLLDAAPNAYRHYFEVFQAALRGA